MYLVALVVPHHRCPRETLLFDPSRGMAPTGGREFTYLPKTRARAPPGRRPEDPSRVSRKVNGAVLGTPA